MERPNSPFSRTDEGLLINLTDNANFSMFRIGSIEPRPQLVRIVSQIGQILTKQSGDIEIRGHTTVAPSNHPHMIIGGFRPTERMS